MKPNGISRVRMCMYIIIILLYYIIVRGHRHFRLAFHILPVVNTHYRLTYLERLELLIFDRYQFVCHTIGKHLLHVRRTHFSVRVPVTNHNDV